MVSVECVEVFASIPSVSRETPHLQSSVVLPLSYAILVVSNCNRALMRRCVGGWVLRPARLIDRPIE